MTDKPRVLLGVNVDHVATIRQARGTRYPDPVFAAGLAGQAGADQITVHLREDRRHIQDRDLEILCKTVQVPLNLEMAATDEMVAVACHVLPNTVTLVPERREERTTEGGLEVAGQQQRLGDVVRRLKDAGIVVSLFIAPSADQVRAATGVGAATIELHTGEYCDAHGQLHKLKHLGDLERAALLGHSLGLRVAAGHGLDYVNVGPVAALPHVEELNIGHSIVARAVLVGLERAVREMRQLLVPPFDMR
jgi:pyridoxine 5-phosphate synthase